MGKLSTLVSSMKMPDRSRMQYVVLDDQGPNQRGLPENGIPFQPSHLTSS